MQMLITDETAAGDILNKIALEIEADKITVKELIAARVRHEVAELKYRSMEEVRSLVQPVKDSGVDADEQIAVAIEAFEQNGFFLLVDDLQVESLDQEVLVRPDAQVSFVKLMPLVGG